MSPVDRERRGDEQDDPARERHARRLDEEDGEDDRQEVAQQELEMRIDEPHG